MDIRQLNYFIQVAECGNYSKAAQKLFVSQPALSKTIKNMEDEMGFTFFYTHQRKQYLTDAGQAFYDKAVHVLKEYEALINTEYEDNGVVSGHLTIGLSTTAGPALFAHISPKFSALYPLIDISLIEKDSGTIIEELFKRNLDAAFTDLYYLTKEDYSLFDVFEVAKGDLVVVVPNDDSFSAKKRISYDDLDGKDIIFYQSDESSFGLFSIDLRASKARPKVVMSSSQWHLIFDLVEANYGITIAPYYIYTKLRTPNITAIPFDVPSSKRTLALIAKKDENRSKALKAFIEFASNKDLYEDLTPRLTVPE